MTCWMHDYQKGTPAEPCAGLVSAGPQTPFKSLYFSLVPCLGTSHWWFGIGHGRNIYNVNIDKPCKSDLFCFSSSFRRMDKHLPGHHSCLTLTKGTSMTEFELWD